MLSLAELLTVIADFADERQRKARWPDTGAPNEWVPNDWDTMLVALAGEDETALRTKWLDRRIGVRLRNRRADQNRICGGDPGLRRFSICLC